MHYIEMGVRALQARKTSRDRIGPELSRLSHTIRVSKSIHLPANPQNYAQSRSNRIPVWFRTIERRLRVMLTHIGMHTCRSWSVNVGLIVQLDSLQQYFTQSSQLAPT